MENFDELSRVDREHYWHAFTQMSEYEPLLVESADGVWLHDHLGRSLIDGVSSMWCNVHGHRRAEIDSAIKEQLGKVAHVTSLGVSNSTTIELTQKLIGVLPTGLDRVFYSSDGSSAVEVALKMAFQYWRQCDAPEKARDLYLAIDYAYHGDSIGSVSVGGVSRFHAMFNPLLFDVVRGPCPDTYRTPATLGELEPNDVRLTEYYLSEYRDLFERFGFRLAAAIVEPLVQGAAGMVVHPPGFLRGLRKLCDEFNVLLIADEIATGMGRTGHMWACEWEDVTPDFLCTGKGLSGGYLPVAATATTKRVWDAFLGEYSESKSFFHGHTYGGNPLGCAAAIATLDIFQTDQTLDRVNANTELLRELLQPLGEIACVGDVRQRGLLAAVELVKDKTTREPYPWSQRRGHLVCQAAIDKGVLLRPLGNNIVIAPPLCIDPQQLAQIVESIQHGIKTAMYD